MSRALLLALGALLSWSCAGGGPGAVPLCQSDAECAQNEVCFPLQGCGDPGGGLVVEVQGNTRTGQLAQDFPIGDGGFSATNDFDLKPATLAGEFLREGGTYQDAVTVRVRGASELIPGIVRSYQATFAKPERGTYSLPVGAGVYQVTAETADTAIPPALAALSVKLGTNTSVSFDFARADKTIALVGRLLKRIESGPAPEIPVGQAMDVQAFDPRTMRPLSQRAPVSSTGDFSLFIAPEASALGAFAVMATPREPGALVPSKTFTLSLPLDPLIRLQLGDFGEPLVSMKGELKFETSDAGVGGATVYVEGPVNGGGTFRSKVVTTNATGGFSLDLLPSADTGSFVLTALPPPGSPAGVVQKQVQAVAGVGVTALRVMGAKDNIVVCPPKIAVNGKLVRPASSTPAAGAAVVAHAIEQLKELGGKPLPLGDTEVVTDEQGRFQLALDPGIYQLDFIPGEDLPRTSRVVKVQAEATGGADGGTGSQAIELALFELRKGRKVTGAVTVTAQNTRAVAINATVRYFRVSAVGGATTSLLLGEAVTDSLGKYSLALPAK